MENLNNIDEQQNTYDFSEFETIGNRVLVVSINKSFVLNTPLRKCFPGRKAELRIKNDCSQIVLLANGEKRLNIMTNGKINNSNIFSLLKQKDIKLPVYYVGEWDDKAKIWIGDLCYENPNEKLYRKNKKLLKENTSSENLEFATDLENNIQ